MRPPRPESLARIADLYAGFYHDAELESEAAEYVRRALADRPEERAALVAAFEDVLSADLPAGLLQELVGRRANVATADDEQARRFVVRTYAAL